MGREGLEWDAGRLCRLGDKGNHRRNHEHAAYRWSVAPDRDRSGHISCSDWPIRCPNVGSTQAAQGSCVKISVLIPFV